MSERVHFIDVPPPDVLWLTAGAKALPQITTGRHVTTGQVVAGVEQTSSVAVAPLDGVVGKMTPVTDSGGRELTGVALLVDDDAETRPLTPGLHASLSVGREDLSAWIARLDRCGLRSDRHTSPPLIRQLLEAIRRPIDTVVCHALEGDPTLPVQIQWALRHPAELRDGLRLLTRLVGARRSLLAVADADHRRLGRLYRRLYPQAGRFSRLVGRRNAAPAEASALDASPAPDEQPLGMQLVPVANTYPQADPTLLLWTLLGRRLRPGRLPTDAGVLMVDAVAAIAVGAIVRGLPVLRRLPIAIRDHRPGREVSVLAEIWRGSRLSDVLTHLGLNTSGEAPVATGGDYLRSQLLPLDAVIDGGELTFHLTGPRPIVQPDPCIRTGWCLEICPTGVHPAGLLEATQRHDADMARRFGAHACIECGLCEYVCPSRLPLLDAARVAKQDSQRE